MSSRITRRTIGATAVALMLLVIPVSSAVARPTPSQFAALMQKALLAKASVYHLSKSQINSAFKDATFRGNLYSAGAIICQKLATESAKQAANDLVVLTKSLSTAGSGGNYPLPPANSKQKLSVSVLKGVIGVGLTVTTAKGSLCPTQAKKAASTLVIYNKAVGAKK